MIYTRADGYQFTVDPNELVVLRVHGCVQGDGARDQSTLDLII